MAYKIEQEQFSGPLDLLLHLIEREELEITQVSISDVADEFLQYMDEHENMPAQELADFLVIASKLLYHKSRAILPSVWMQENVEEDDLENQLKMYKAFVDASKQIQEKISEKKFMYSREQIILKREQGFYPPQNVDEDELQSAFARVIEKLKPLIKLPQAAMRRVMSIKEKISFIKDRIAQVGKGKFRDLVSKDKNKTDVIVSFLAMLELVKQKELKVEQEDLFEEISLEKV